MFTKKKTNICKGVATLMLLFHHLFYVMEFFDYYNMKFYFFSHNHISGISDSSRVCLWMFVFLSAYGLTYKYLHTPEENRYGFVSRQWFSLMKPFWFVYVIAITAVSLSGHDMIAHFHGNFFLCILDFLGWSDFFHTPTLSGAFWYMCLAQIVILLIPLTCKFLKRLSDYGLISLTFLVILALQYLPSGIYSVYSKDYLKCLPVFILGCRFAQNDILNRLSQKKLTTSRRILICAVLLVLTIVFKISIIKIPNIDQWKLWGVFESVSAVLICLLMGIYLKLPVLDKVLAYIGKHSGLIYLIHAILYFWLPQVVFITRSAMVDYLVLLGESLALSVLVVYLRKLTRYDALLDRGYAFLSKKVENL